MPQLTPEETAKLNEKIEFIKQVYLSNCLYPYRQVDELKKTRKYRKSEGVCFAMSLDWMRRKMWNAYNPGMKQKRNFNDLRFAKKKKRVALTNKHGKLQDVYEQQRKPFGPTPVQTILGKMAAANIVSTGMDRMTATQLSHISGYELSEEEYEKSKDKASGPTGAPNTHFEFKDRFRDVLSDVERRGSEDHVPAVGLLFGMQAKSGHAVALFLESDRYTFFDPNLGEYAFDPRTQVSRMINFVADVWFDIYHRYFGMDTLTFTLLKYKDP